MSRRAMWRIPWLRAIALASGLAIFAGQIFSNALKYTPAIFPPDIRDMVIHVTLFASFALLYYLSWRGAPEAGLATIALCSSWGALCEYAQLGVSGRTFAPAELAANVLTPIAVVAVLGALGWLKRWLSGE